MPQKKSDEIYRSFKKALKNLLDTFIIINKTRLSKGTPFDSRKYISALFTVRKPPIFPQSAVKGGLAHVTLI